MKGFKKGTELELQDGSKVTIESFSIERQEILFQHYEKARYEWIKEIRRLIE